MSESFEILVFAKAPEEGKVKTRLISKLGARGAVELYEELLRQQMSQLSQLKDISITYWCTPTTHHSVFAYGAEHFGFRLKQQPEGDLGDRMKVAARDGLSRASAVVLIGVDCPAMTNVYLVQAMDHLRQNKQVVVGPAEDGGYVLLALRQMNDQLFRNIEWGTSSVLGETLERLNAAESDYALLPELWDLDRPEDLLRYRALRRSG